MMTIINILILPLINITHHILSYLMILIGFALDSLILALRTPAGFIASIFSLGFLEKRAAQSIIKDTDTTKIRNFFEHIKNRVPPIKSQQRKYNI